MLHTTDPLVRATHCSFRFILFILFLRSYFPLYSSYPILSSLPLTPPLFLPPLQSKLILYLLYLPSFSSHLSLLSSLLIFPSPPLLSSSLLHPMYSESSSLRNSLPTDLDLDYRNGQILVKCTTPFGARKSISPEDISAEILTALRRSAEEYLRRRPVNDEMCGGEHPLIYSSCY